jgi:hypothetical protein
MALFASCDERRDAIVVGDVVVSAVLEEELDDLGMALLAGPD